MTTVSVTSHSIYNSMLIVMSFMMMMMIMIIIHPRRLEEGADAGRLDLHGDHDLIIADGSV